MRLGLVTYNLAKDWDIPTIIKNCEAAGFEGVELRTTHKHGVEPTLTKEERAKVKQTFEASKVRLVSLGTTCEYQSQKPDEVEKNIEETRRWVELAHDLYAVGVKVRPNGFPSGASEAATLKQIGQALRKCGAVAKDHGVQIWLEVHGKGTSLPSNIRTVMEHCGHPSVGACWNSNATDVENGSVRRNFEMLRPWLKSCHINELWTPYPWRELFSLMNATKYDGYTLAEVPESKDPERLMKYYRALWTALSKT
jgi:sugar phosphate isomerase/epimerase